MRTAEVLRERLPHSLVIRVTCDAGVPTSNEARDHRHADPRRWRDSPQPKTPTASPRPRPIPCCQSLGWPLSFPSAATSAGMGFPLPSFTSPVGWSCTEGFPVCFRFASSPCETASRALSGV